MNILKGLHQSGRTVIIITHDDDIAEQAHRVVRIMDGRIEADYLNSEKNTDSEEIVDKETNIDSEREDI